MGKKIKQKIYIGLVISGIAFVIFILSSVYLNFQIRELTIFNNKIPSDPFILMWFLMWFPYLWLWAVILGVLFWTIYVILELFWEIFFRKIINTYDRVYLIAFFIVIMLFSATQIYNFVLHTVEDQILMEKKILNLGIKKNAINLSEKQSTEIYSKLLKKYWLPGNNKNLLYSDIEKKIIWDKDNFFIFFRNSRDIVLKNETRNTTINYSINKYYPYIGSISFDVFQVPNSDLLEGGQEVNNYLFLRVDLKTQQYRSLFLAFNKNGELLYEELANSLDK